MALAALPPLRRARAEALLWWLLDDPLGLLLMPDSHEYGQFTGDGWSREDIEQAVDDLAAVQIARITPGPSVSLVVKLDADFKKVFENEMNESYQYDLSSIIMGPHSGAGVVVAEVVL
jgi:hypothetical protein